MRGTLLTPPQPSSSPPSSPTSHSLTPKPHSPILAARQHLRVPVPQRQAVDVVCVAPEGPLQGEGQCQNEIRKECLPLPPGSRALSP